MSSVSPAQASTLSYCAPIAPRFDKLVIDQVIQVVTIDALATASFITSGGTADASATTYTGAARQFPIRRIAAKVEVNGDIAQNVSMVNDVFEQQIQAKMIAMWNAVGDKLINGTGADRRELMRSCDISNSQGFGGSVDAPPRFGSGAPGSQGDRRVSRSSRTGLQQDRGG